MSEYLQFLERKQVSAGAVGFEVGEGDINPMLYDFQREIVQWALNLGRAALFCDCGLGKTPMQLEWANHISRYTQGDVLILAPLAVAPQTVNEGKKFGIDVTHCREASDIRPGINITNYERLDKFKSHEWVGVVLDESSILKAFDGKTRSELTEWGQSIEYRLCCTATPSPNDHEELGGHSEFLGIMTRKQMLATFFVNDGLSAAHWRLKGHGQSKYWSWIASWAMVVRSPSDLGYDNHNFTLPPLNIEIISVDVDTVQEGRLFSVPVSTLSERRQARRESIADRVQIAADIVNGSDEAWGIWCDLNDESVALNKSIPDAVEVQGSFDAELKEDRIIAFGSGEARAIISKSSITGYGLNWQHCHNCLFVGLSDSYEQYYQAIRRFWRYGQTKPVRVVIIASNREQTVLENIRRKEAQAIEMFEGVAKATATERKAQRMIEAEWDEARSDDWTLKLGDSIERIKEVESESVGLCVFSPPFPGMYVYTDSEHDMGNAKSVEELIEHYSFLAPELLRITQPGRSCAVHLTQAVRVKHLDGYSGIKDFRGAAIQCMENAGWIYYGEVCIDKDPQVKAIRTKDHGLLFKTLANDSAKMHMCLADYLLQFRKPGENANPIRAGISSRYDNNGGWITQEEWIEWAAPVWYRATDDYPGGIRETDVLNAAVARGDKDERHICPLQLGVIERAVKLWSAPGDIVFSPFAGIGSEGYVSLKHGRRFVGIELKRSYWECAQRNLKNAESRTMGLFDNLPEEAIA